MQVCGRPPGPTGTQPPATSPRWRGASPRLVLYARAVPEEVYCHAGHVLTVERINVSHSLTEPVWVEGRRVCPICEASWPVEDDW